MSDGPSPTPSRGVPRPVTGTARRAPPRRAPNYAARRMLVGTIVVTLLFAAGIVGWNIVSGDGDGGSLRRRSEWSSIAVVDRVTGDVVHIGPDGTVLAESAANGRTGSIYQVGGRLLLVNSQRIAVLPEPGSDDQPVIAELPRGATIVNVAGRDVEYLAAGIATGGNVIIVDPASGATHDLDEMVAGTLSGSPAMLVDSVRTNDDGSIVAVADATNFQTIVMRPGDDDPVFLPDQPVAVGDSLVATSQIVGTQADVALVALDRSTKAAVPTEIPAGGVFDGDDLVIVSTVGRLLRIRPGAERALRVGLVDLPTGAMVSGVHPTYGGERLVVTSETSEAVTDLAGEVLFSATFTDSIDGIEPEPDWACLPVGGAGGAHSLIDLENGEQLVDLTGLQILGVADQGCTVLVDRSGTAEVITADGSATLGLVVSALIGPDGRSVLRTAADGVTDLVLLADDLTVSNTIDLTDVIAGVGGNPLIIFIERPR